MDYTIEKGKILSESGVPYLPRWFCDDLVCFEIDKHGISKVEYFNRTTKGSEKIFIDDMWGGMRFFVEENGYHVSPQLTECEIMPYGIKGEWHYKDFVFSYEQRVVNNTIFTILNPIKTGKARVRFDVEFYDSWRFVPLKYGDFRYVNDKIDRSWTDFEYNNNILNVRCDEEGKSTFIKIASNVKFEHKTRTIGFKKNMLTSEKIEQDGEIVFAMAFDDCESSAQKRVTESVKNYKELFKKQNERYERVIEKSPVLESPYKSLNNFFALAPIYHESCKIPSVPGGIHAKTEHYWIWGWDGMSSGYTYAYWGDMDFVEDMLKMYMETADKEKGIGHWFARDMSHIQTSMIPAQGFYINLLYQYHKNGGNISMFYNFAKKIFEMIASTEAQGKGLCKGYSLVPDFRETILENGNDLSAFNNSSSYCAVCAMRELAKANDDRETYEKASALAERMKDNFVKILFDEEKGFFVSSADATTLEQRKVYMSPSMKWDNLFCYDLVKDKQKQIVDFFEKNFVCECGIMYAPVWGAGYDADANQMHCYWPSNGECYARLINYENRKDLIEKQISWISCWTDILMCPEGIDCYSNINEPKPDGWNAVNGTWQAYSMRAWYEAAVHSIIGIDFDQNGMNIYPYDGEEMTLKNLHFAGKTFDIYMKGSGTEIERADVNGVSAGVARSIDMACFDQAHNTVTIIRK